MRYLDVRSPSEYRKGHIPCALSLPLFSDQERVEIGTCYKQVGKKQAIALGLEKVAAKAESFLNQGLVLFPGIPFHLGKQIFDRGEGWGRSQPCLVGEAKNQSSWPKDADASEREFRETALEGILYCSRGGMRSEAAAHFFRAAGIEVTTLPGGYKAYRKWVREVLDYPYAFKVLSGKTGAGKTEALQNLGEPFIDLEALASHRGSSFGALETPQPTQEHFENLLAEGLSKLKKEPIWIEDESRMIGSLKIPDPIWKRMCEGERWILDTPIEERITRLIQEYGNTKKTKLIAATERLEKKLGRERTVLVTCAIENGDYSRAVREILPYYDKAYEKSLNNE